MGVAAMRRVGILLFPLLVLAVAFSGMPVSVIVAEAEPYNNVSIVFGSDWVYDSTEDAFINGQVTGRKMWYVNMGNTPDGTGAPVSALALSLESTLTFDNFKEENLVTSGPPTYEWSFGDVPEWSGADTWVDLLSNPVPVTFAPGFDASRSVDKTEFWGPGTQTLTIALTPREVTEGFNILVQAFEDDVVNTVITSPTSGEGVLLGQEGHSLHIDPTGLALNIPWTVTVTIQVTPKVPKVVFMPYVLVGWGETVAFGTTRGSSVSHPVGNPFNEVGTWTWSVEGSYQWDWKEDVSRLVSWRPSSGAGEVGNRIDVGFMDELDYEVSGNTFTNDKVTGKRRWRTNFTNWPDETGAPVTGLGVILETKLAFDGIERDKLTRMGPPTYEWYLGEVVEEPERQGWPWDAFVELFRSPPQFSPGADVSRSFDKTVFTAPDTQTMTVTLTPREEWVETISIFVHTDEYDIVNPVIMSISHTGGGETHIMEDGHRSGIERIPVELNTPLIITYKLQVTPKVSEVEYSPSTGILLYRSGVLASGTNSGNSVSYTNEAGTWTWSAEGDYVWHWVATTPDYTVTFPEMASQGEETTSTPEGPTSWTHLCDYGLMVSLRKPAIPTPTNTAGIAWPASIGNWSRGESKRNRHRSSFFADGRWLRTQ
jgi:hypothetical protein